MKIFGRSLSSQQLLLLLAAIPSLFLIFFFKKEGFFKAGCWVSLMVHWPQTCFTQRTVDQTQVLRGKTEGRESGDGEIKKKIMQAHAFVHKCNSRGAYRHHSPSKTRQSWGENSRRGWSISAPHAMHSPASLSELSSASVHGWPVARSSSRAAAIVRLYTDWHPPTQLWSCWQLVREEGRLVPQITAAMF